jgi:hypothetical protein
MVTTSRRKDKSMVAGTLPILIGWNLIAIPVALWLLSKRTPGHATRTFRRSY